MAGQQRAEVVFGRHRRQAGEHVFEVVVGIVAAALAGDDERVHDGGAVTGVGVADEEQFFFPIAEGRMAFSTALVSSLVWL